jgi:hypothetical protein
MKHQSLLNLGWSLREAFLKAKGNSTLTLDVNSTNYLFGAVNESDCRVIVGAFKQYISETDMTDEIKEKILASPILEEYKYHVTLLYPSENSLNLAAKTLNIEIPEKQSKKQRSQLNSSIFRELRSKNSTVEMTFGDNAFLTTDGELAGIEMKFTTRSIFADIDQDKVFHITLTHNRDVEERAPAYSNIFLKDLTQEQ